jgi:hypothetical protein
MTSYRITLFDGIELPAYNSDRDESPGVVASPLRPSLGGVWDMAGSRRLLPQSRQIKLSGVYAAEWPYYLVDDVGDNLVDGSDPLITTGSQIAESRDQLDLLTSRIGMRGTLVRAAWDATAVAQTCVARLMSVKPKFGAKLRTAGNEVELVFETTRLGWRSSVNSVTSTVGTLIAPVTGNLPVFNAVLVITASATITSVAVRVPESGCSWTWTGTLTTGQVLTIDAENQTVRIGSTDASSGFALASGHTSLNWLELDPGHNNVSAVVDGSHSATLSWFDVFA